MAENTNTLDLANEFGDFNMDDVADLPEIVSFPTGTHKVSLKIKLDKTKPDAAAIASGKSPQRVVIFDWSYIAPVEVAEGVAVPNASDKDFARYYIDSEFGAGMFKGASAGLREHFQTANVFALYEQCKEGIEVMLTCKSKVKPAKGQYEASTETIVVTMLVL